MKFVLLHDDVMCDTSGGLYRAKNGVIESHWYGPVRRDYQDAYERVAAIDSMVARQVGIIIRGVLATSVMGVTFVTGVHDDFTERWEELDEERKDAYGMLAMLLRSSLNRGLQFDD